MIRVGVGFLVSGRRELRIRSRLVDAEQIVGSNLERTFTHHDGGDLGIQVNEMIVHKLAWQFNLGGISISRLLTYILVGLRKGKFCHLAVAVG